MEAEASVVAVSEAEAATPVSGCKGRIYAKTIAVFCSWWMTESKRALLPAGKVARRCQSEHALRPLMLLVARKPDEKQGGDPEF